MTKRENNSIKERRAQSDSNRKDISKRKPAFWNLGAALGLIGGLWFFTAAVFMTVSEFLFSDNPKGSWLFLAVLPLWLFGAYCFDKPK